MPSVSAEDASVDELLDQVETMLSQSDSAHAVELCSKILTVDKKNDEAYGLRAQAYLQQGEGKKALNDLDHSLQLNEKDNPAAYFMRSGIYLSMGNPKKAMLDINQAISQDAPQADYYTLRGKIYMSQGSYPEAQEDFSEALHLDAQQKEAWCARGVLRMSDGQFDGALDDFDQALALDEWYAEAYFCKALDLEQLREEALAVETYQKYLACPSNVLDDANVLLAKQRISYLQGKLKQNNASKYGR